MRTIAGLKRADVIWRQVDSEWIDPLELNSDSRLGVPGLIEAIRSGGVAVENMPGAGFIESRAMLAFLPRLAERLIGKPLQMPNIATWWCGQRGERARVLDKFDRDLHRQRLRRRRARAGEAARRRRRRTQRGRARGAEGGDRGARARLCRPGGRAALDHAALGEGQAGPAPVRAARLCRGDAGRLEGDARRLRPHLRQAGRARGLDGRRRRIRRRLGARRQAGAPRASLLPTPEKTRIARLLGNLPSRAADNLFWFGRYLERAEATLRLVRVLSARAVDPEGPMTGGREAVEGLKGLLVAWGAIDAKANSLRPAETALRSTRELRLRALHRQLRATSRPPSSASG